MKTAKETAEETHIVPNKMNRKISISNKFIIPASFLHI